MTYARGIVQGTVLALAAVARSRLNADANFVFTNRRAWLAAFVVPIVVWFGGTMILRGDLVHCPGLGGIEILRDHLLGA